MKRARKGSGCVFQTKFRTKEGKEKLGGWRYKFTHKGATYNEGVAARNKQEAQEGMARRKAEVMSGSFIKGSEAETLRYETMREYLLRHYEVEGCKSLRTARSGEKFIDRKSTRLNSSHGYISYAVFCLKKKKKTEIEPTVRLTQQFNLSHHNM